MPGLSAANVGGDRHGSNEPGVRLQLMAAKAAQSGGTAPAVASGPGRKPTLVTLKVTQPGRAGSSGGGGGGGGGAKPEARHEQRPAADPQQAARAAMAARQVDFAQRLGAPRADPVLLSTSPTRLARGHWMRPAFREERVPGFDGWSAGALVRNTDLGYNANFALAIIARALSRKWCWSR